MKVYCAGPLFTPYEREFMSTCGRVLRENGIDAFVPHESPKPDLPPELLRFLLRRGLVSEEELRSKPHWEILNALKKAGKVTDQDLEPFIGTPAKRVFNNDFGAISSSNAMLAVVNGPEVDDGTACEIGVFYALMLDDPSKKGIVALHQDWRTEEHPGEGKGLNAFVLGCLLKAGKICHSLDEAGAILKKWQAELESEGHQR